MGTNQNLISNLKTIGVLGAGQMGNGIAQVAAATGYDVILCDISEESLKKAIKTVTSSLEKLVSKNIITEELKTSALSRIKTSTQLGDLKNVDVFIEAATENIELKLKIFKDVDALIKHAQTVVQQRFGVSLRTEIRKVGEW